MNINKKIANLLSDREFVYEPFQKLLNSLCLEINNLLLELNGLFWHNYRPYKNTESDKKEYYSLKQKGGMYKAIAKHWKYDDVRKLNYCINNNINFLAIYFDALPENILELIEKYKVGQTILIYRDNKLTVQRLSKSDN